MRAITKLEKLQEELLEEYMAVTSKKYTDYFFNNEGKSFTDPRLTSGDVSKELEIERNKTRKLIDDTFNECLMDIVYLDPDQPNRNFGRKSRAKFLISYRDLEIMRMIWKYKKFGIPDNIIKNVMVNRKVDYIQERSECINSDVWTQTAILNAVSQAMKDAFESYYVQLQSNMDEIAEKLANIEDKIDYYINKVNKEKNEKEWLKKELAKKDNEIESLKEYYEHLTWQLNAEIKFAQKKKYFWQRIIR